MNKHVTVDELPLEPAAQPNGALTPHLPIQLQAVVKPEHENNPDAFDWLENASVIVPEQAAIAVYLNPRGDYVIRQERSWCEDEDHVVCVRPENLMALIDRLCDLAGIPSAGGRQ